MTYRKRALTALVAGALALPLLATTSANAAPGDDNPPPPRNIAEFCKNVPANYNPFIDDEPNTHAQAIECAAFAEVARGGPGGKPANEYGPRLNVQRDQMASFIARMIDEANEQDCNNTIRPLPATGTDRFTDDEQSIHEAQINRLAQVGIVVGGPNGTSPTLYGPRLPVQRDQMASFILRAIEYMTGDDINSTKDYYTDDERSIHEPNINSVSDLAIAVGERPDTFNPFGNIFRDQMASFLVRTLAYLNDAEGIAPAGEDCPAAPPANDTTAPTLVDAQVATEGAGATGTATTGDVFELTFSENITTDGATATDNAMATDTAIATDAAFTVVDEDGDTALIQCGIEAGGNDNATAAECEINGAVLTVTLLEDADDTNAGGDNDGLQFPLTITDIFNVFDEAGNEATLTGSTDIVINDES